MNILKRLRHLADLSKAPKGYGKTTLLIKACKDIDGVFITATKEEANHIQKTYGVTAYVYDRNLSGLKGPFFFDHKVIEKIFKKAANKIEELEEKAAHYDMIKAQNDDLKSELAEFDGEYF